MAFAKASPAIETIGDVTQELKEIIALYIQGSADPLSSIVCKVRSALAKRVPSNILCEVVKARVSEMLRRQAAQEQRR